MVNYKYKKIHKCMKSTHLQYNLAYSYVSYAAISITLYIQNLKMSASQISPLRN